MIISDFNSFGGKHWETAAIKNVLAHAGVTAPHTNKPLSEAMALGIGGGISAGYSFCPSIVRWDTGSGVTIIGRALSYSTAGAFYRSFFERIGAKLHITETGGVKAAFKNLLEQLDAGRPTIVFCARWLLPYAQGEQCVTGMYSMIVHGISESRGEAYISDRAPNSLTVPLDVLEESRNRICSFKNRTISIDRLAKLTKAGLNNAVMDGIRACILGFRKPQMKTFNLEGIAEWAKMVTNSKNAKGWLRVYSGGNLYLALRDVFDTIETVGTGGSLFRPMYADFLDEAAKVTGRKALAHCASTYRSLGKMWSEVADAALPGKVKPFKRTRDLLLKKNRLMEDKGASGLKQIIKTSGELDELAKEMTARFPLNESEMLALLENLQQRIIDVHDAEWAAVDQLEAAGS